MKIPKKFKLFGQTINVTSSLKDFIKNDHWGLSSFQKNEIQLRPSTVELPFSEEQLEQTFWHELTHFVLYYASSSYSGEKEYMHKNEGFVEMVSNLYHQAVSTFEY